MLCLFCLGCAAKFFLNIMLVSHQCSAGFDSMLTGSILHNYLVSIASNIINIVSQLSQLWFVVIAFLLKKCLVTFRTLQIWKKCCVMDYFYRNIFKTLIPKICYSGENSDKLPHRWWHTYVLLHKSHSLCPLATIKVSMSKTFPHTARRFPPFSTTISTDFWKLSM